MNLWVFVIFFPLWAFIDYVIIKEQSGNMNKCAESKKFIKHCASILSNHTENAEIELLYNDMVSFCKPVKKKKTATGPGLRGLLLRNGIEPTKDRDEDVKLAKRIMKD